MRFSIVLSCVFVIILSAGCSSRMAGWNVGEFEGLAELHYPPSSGRIDVRTYLGYERLKLDVQRFSLKYSVQPEGEDLLWVVEVDGKILGLKDGAVVKPETLKELFQSYPLEDSHPTLEFRMRTDRLGNIIAMESISEAATGSSMVDTYWEGYYPKVFSMVFVPFLQSNASVGMVVSHERSLIPPQYVDHYSEASIVLAGEKTFKGHDCYVLEYKLKSNPYKNANRQKVVNSMDAALFLDKETKVLRWAKGIQRGKNAPIIVEAKYSEIVAKEQPEQ